MYNLKALGTVVSPVMACPIVFNRGSHKYNPMKKTKSRAIRTLSIMVRSWESFFHSHAIQKKCLFCPAF